MCTRTRAISTLLNIMCVEFIHIVNIWLWFIHFLCCGLPSQKYNITYMLYYGWTYELISVLFLQIVLTWHSFTCLLLNMCTHSCYLRRSGIAESGGFMYVISFSRYSETVFQSKGASLYFSQQCRIISITLHSCHCRLIFLFLHPFQWVYSSFTLWF